MVESISGDVTSWKACQHPNRNKCKQIKLQNQGLRTFPRWIGKRTQKIFFLSKHFGLIVPELGGGQKAVFVFIWTICLRGRGETHKQIATKSQDSPKKQFCLCVLLFDVFSAP